MKKRFIKYFNTACIMTAIAVSITACSSDDIPKVNDDDDNA